MPIVFKELLRVRMTFPVAIKSAGGGFSNRITGSGDILSRLAEWYWSMRTRDQAAATDRDYCTCGGKWAENVRLLYINCHRCRPFETNLPTDSLYIFV